jgi:hypothetical protein
MKKRLLISALALISVVLASCSFDEDEAFAKNLAPAGDIQFVVDQTALATAASTVVQPSYDVIAARFSKSANATVTVKISSSNLTKLTVNYVSATGVRQAKSTVDVSGGSVVWSNPMSTLGLNNAAVTTGTVTLEFVASSSDGSSSVARIFSVTAF